MVGMPIDFGATADDYARYRTTFPPELFAELATLNIGLPGHRIVDVGTGTGVLARDLAAAGCRVTGLDISPELLAQAEKLNVDRSVDYRVGSAEDTGLPAAVWDVVTAGQCWHWFDRPRALAEARRLLVPGGALVICYRDYVVTPGGVCAASEELVLAHHPGWPLAGTAGQRPEWADELARAGFGAPELIDFTVDVMFTHAAWRGRMRSSNGVGASLAADQVAAFDADLAGLLAARFPEPLAVPHRIWAWIARRATEARPTNTRGSTVCDQVPEPRL